MANVFFNPSKEETFGLTTAEALSCETPAIVYNVTACPEVVTYDTGFIIEKGDLDSVIKIINVIREKEKEFYSDKSRNRTVECFNINDRFKDYIDLYNSILEKKI